MGIYINSISQISVQEPLSEKWLEAPSAVNAGYTAAVDPDFKKYFSPVEARRMGVLLKRAVAVSAEALSAAGMECPQGVITGTGLGCIDNSAKFLNAMIDNAEECLPPTPFMQSTHNTIGSQISQHFKCHGYNSTYSHRGTSFDSCLLDAFVQMKLGAIPNALVGSHDEMPGEIFAYVDRIKLWRGCCVAGGHSVAMVLSGNPSGALCSLGGMEMLYKPSLEDISRSTERLLGSCGLSIDDIDAVVLPLDGDSNDDAVSISVNEKCFNSRPAIRYRHIFGESFSASAFGIYVAATCLARQEIPEHLRASSGAEYPLSPRNILVYNHFKNKEHSLVLLQL